jgi:maltooligosyltrehalose trehalohydrolase
LDLQKTDKENPFYEKVGSFYKEDGSCDFIVWAPFKKAVSVVITSPEKQECSMVQDDRGYWKVTVENVKPGLRYMFKLDGEMERPDPASISQHEGVHKASEVIDRSFAWSDKAWKGKNLGELIIYELHVGTFSKLHNFEGVIAKLGYLKDLGINAIEIMPVAQFPGDRNWGYDGVYPYAVQNSYGGVDGLKKLVDAAHASGIAVILDVVYNHMGPEGNYLNDYGPYFTQKYKTPWGPALNYDDAWCDAVRNYFLQNALMWLNEFHIDGLRIDAVHAIWDFSAQHFMEELKEQVNYIEKQTGQKKILIAEIDLNNVRYINPKEKGGYGLDGQWIDEFHHALHSVLTGQTDGYYEDFGEMYHIEKAFKNTYVYNGTFSPHRKKIFGSDPSENPYSQFVVFSQNHDQVGNRMLGDRLTGTLSFEELKLAAATVLLSPYVPLLFMGEEYGEKNPFLFFISHGDKEVVENTRKGRREEFAYFNFTGDFPDPDLEQTFRKSMLEWNIEDKQHATLLGYYKYLIEFRKTRLAMQGRSRDTMIVHPLDDEKILAIERFFNNDHLLIVFNFNKERAEYTNSGSNTYKKIFDSSSEKWSGVGEITGAEVSAPQQIGIGPSSVLIFEKIK